MCELRGCPRVAHKKTPLHPPGWARGAGDGADHRLILRGLRNRGGAADRPRKGTRVVPNKGEVGGRRTQNCARARARATFHGREKGRAPRGASGGQHSPGSGGMAAERAERADVTTATVARIERDEIEPRMTTLRKLAQGLEVDPAELVSD